MNESSKELNERSPSVLKEPAGNFDFELPVEPGYRERPPKGSWEAGYYLSLMALEMVKNRPEIFEERDRRMCSVEFKM